MNPEDDHITPLHLPLYKETEQPTSLLRTQLRTKTENLAWIYTQFVLLQSGLSLYICQPSLVPAAYRLSPSGISPSPSCE